MEDFGNLNKFSDKKHSFDDFNPEEEEDDSDDENLPNLEWEKSVRWFNDGNQK